MFLTFTHNYSFFLNFFLFLREFSHNNNALFVWWLFKRKLRNIFRKTEQCRYSERLLPTKSKFIYVYFIKNNINIDLNLKKKKKLRQWWNKTIILLVLYGDVLLFILYSSRNQKIMFNIFRSFYKSNKIILYKYTLFWSCKI